MRNLVLTMVLLAAAPAARADVFSSHLHGNGTPHNEKSSSRSVGKDGVTLEFSSATTRNATGELSVP